MDLCDLRLLEMRGRDRYASATSDNRMEPRSSDRTGPAASMDDSDRRRFGRRDLDLIEVDASVLILRLEQRVRALAIEISAGGMRLECEPPNAPPQSGDTVVVRLSSPTAARSLTLPGEIAWVRSRADGCALGLSFAGNRDEIDHMLAPFMAHVDQHAATNLEGRA